jgi:tetratricopeptide (TPR) repeat protein
MVTDVDGAVPDPTGIADPVRRDAIERALRAFEAYGVPFGRAVGLRRLGELDHAERRLDAALTNLMAAVELSAQTGSMFEQAVSLKALGGAHQANGDEDAARAACDRALALFKRLGNDRETQEVTGLLTS